MILNNDFQPRRTKKMTDVKELMRGGYDLHVHSAPDCLPRKMDDIDMAKRITDSTLAGYAIKNHWTSTAGRAQLINKMFPGCDAVGTITLNSAVGGLNPTAVEMAARGGVKLVWFPTCDNEHEMAYQFDGNPNKKRAFWASIILEMKEQGIVTPTLNCLDESGELKQEVLDILDIIARYDMILATGHISHEEAFKLVPEAAKRGVKKIVVTHVSFPTTHYTIEEQKMFASYGAKCEHCYTTFKTGKEDFSVIADMIKAVGAKNCIIGTDLGNTKLCYPDEGMYEFGEMLLEAGLSEDDIRMLAVTNPRWLIGKE